MKGVADMHVSVREFVESPALYLDKIEDGSVQIVKDGHTIAILSKPSSTPIADSLLGLLKDAGITSADDIKAKTDALITRDPDGFVKVDIPVISPAEFVV